MKIWILTTEYNRYDQEGAYFVAVWLHKPSTLEIEATIDCGLPLAEHILTGGGRRKFEDQWYNLIEVKEGEKFQ